MRRITAASHAAVIGLILAVLTLKLVPAAITGFLIYGLTHRGAESLARCRVSRHVRRPLSLAFVLTAIILIIAASGIVIGNFLSGQEGISWVVLKLAAILDQQRATLPAFITSHLPASVDELKDGLVRMLQQHAEKLSAVGVDSLKTGAHILLGLVVGGLTACYTFAPLEDYRPLSAALLTRLGYLRQAFDKVVFAQVRVSALNTALTGVYLLLLLPLFGVELPLAKTLVLITFVVGLIPVAGNLISNSVIVTLSFGLSFKVAIASLAFLILIHKLEYFVNARIVGSRIHASAWELIMTMMGMEALFGVPGLVIAPVLYAYFKHELTEAGLIGRQPRAA